MTSKTTSLINKTNRRKANYSKSEREKKKEKRRDLKCFKQRNNAATATILLIYIL